MSNEEVCKQALRNLENINLDIVLDELGYEKAEEVSVYGINDYPTLEKQGDIDVLRELIKEQSYCLGIQIHDTIGVFCLWLCDNRSLLSMGTGLVDI